MKVQDRSDDAILGGADGPVILGFPDHEAGIYAEDRPTNCVTVALSSHLGAFRTAFASHRPEGELTRRAATRPHSPGRHALHGSRVFFASSSGIAFADALRWRQVAV